MVKSDEHGTRSRGKKWLRDWQGKIFFEKKYTLSAGSKWQGLTLPASFVSQHGDKFQRRVKLQSMADRKLWTVTVNVCFPHHRPQVLFGSGWKAFALSNGIVKGDRLTFTLIAMSKFEVSIVRSGGNSKAVPSVQWPKIRTKDYAFSQRQPQKYLLRTDSTGNGSKNSESELQGLFAKTETAMKDVAHLTSGAADSSKDSSDMCSHFFEPMEHKNEQDAMSKSLNDTDCHGQS